MASRKQGKGNTKPTKKRLTAAQKHEREWQTVYDKAMKNFYKLQAQGFIDTRGKFSDASGYFYRKKPKRIGTRQIESLKKWSYKYMAENMEYQVSPTQRVSGKRGLEIQHEEAGKRAATTRKIRKYEEEHPEQKYNYYYKPPEPEQPQAPSVDIMEQLDAMIEKLPEYKWIGRGKQFDFTDIKYELHQALDNNWFAIVMQDDEELAVKQEREYLNFLTSHKSQIEEAIEGIQYPSDEKEIEDAAAKAMRWINAAPLPEDLAKKMEA